MNSLVVIKGLTPMHAKISEKPQFVILSAFYPIALTVSYKFSAHYQPLISRVFHTRGGIITVANVQPLRVTELSNQLSFLGINIMIKLVKFSTQIKIRIFIKQII